MIDYVVDKSNRFKLSSSSKGTQIKWYKEGYFLKADTYGYESLSEYICSLILNKWGIPHAYYTPCFIVEGNKKYRGCISPSFLGVNESLISFARLFEGVNKDYVSTLNSFSQYKEDELVYAIRYIVDFFRSKYSVDIGQYLLFTLFFDSFVLNEDRHLNNIALVKDSNILRCCPVFDNGLSLLSDLRSYSLRNKNIPKLINKSESGTFGVSFEKQLNACLRLGFKPTSISDLYSIISSTNSLSVYYGKEFERLLSVLELQISKYKEVLS